MTLKILIILFILMKLFLPLRANFYGKDKNFAHLLLSLQWPTTFVEYNSRGGNYDLLADHKERYGYLFTIHGLWPQSGRGPYGPTNCNHSDAFNLNSVSKIKNIDKYWPSFGMPTTRFWRYEWEKHGTCASHLDGMTKMQEYFEFTVDKAQKFDENVTKELLLEFSPSNSKYISSTSFKKAIENLHKNTVDIKCWGQSLSGIQICFDLELNPMDCPSLPNSKCKGDIKLPS